MTTRVEDKVAMWVSAHPGSTLPEIARGVHASDGTVRDVLGGPLFRFSLSGKAYRYWLRGSREPRRDEVTRPVPESDTDYLHRILGDGRWHTIGEINRRSVTDRGHGFTIHSRVADLRKRGLTVENETNVGKARGENSRYRLLSEGDARAVETGDPATFPVQLDTVPTSRQASPSLSSPEPLTETTGSRVPERGRSLGERGLSQAASVATPPVSVSSPVTAAAGQLRMTGREFTKRREAA